MLDSSLLGTTIADRLSATISRLSHMPRPQKRLFMMVLDSGLCVCAVWFSYFLRLGEWRFLTEDVGRLTVGSLAFWYLGASIKGVYREVFRYAGAGSLTTIAQAIAIMLIPMIVVFLVILVPGVPRTLSVLQPLVFFLFLMMSRIGLRHLILDLSKLSDFKGRQRRILIYGAGDAGQRLAASIMHEPGLVLVGFVDDDLAVAGHRLDRHKIHHSSTVADLVKGYGVTDIYLAMPQLSRARRAEVIDGLTHHQVQVLTLPDMRNIIEGDVSIDDLREVEISDLLGRAPVPPDPELLARTIAGKVVMVTGAGGSIGSELCAQIARLQPRKLILVELSEFALYSIEQDIRSSLANLGHEAEVVPELCNVADAPSISRIVERHRPETLFHAAAYKHVPLVESNVIGGTRNNVMGTLNTVLAARQEGTRNFILISSDKAVRPTSIMGATKRICELILQAFAANAGAEDKTIFAMVRFGNVLGSSGSVVPLFKRQIREGGPITLTDKRITRYFMTIPEAAELVIQAGAMARGGEVYVLDMGQSVGIIDLARSMIRLSGLREKSPDQIDGDIEIVEIGLRPGEKLYEELLIGDDPRSTEHERIMQAQESHRPLAELMEELSRLADSLDCGDADRARASIQRLVPEYAPGREGINGSLG